MLETLVLLNDSGKSLQYRSIGLFTIEVNHNTAITDVGQLLPTDAKHKPQAPYILPIPLARISPLQ